jgi:formylglycine-generating enzyme required for sulfatase activity
MRWLIPQPHLTRIAVPAFAALGLVTFALTIPITIQFFDSTDNTVMVSWFDLALTTRENVERARVAPAEVDGLEARIAELNRATEDLESNLEAQLQRAERAEQLADRRATALVDAERRMAAADFAAGAAAADNRALERMLRETDAHIAYLRVRLAAETEARERLEADRSAAPGLAAPADSEGRAPSPGTILRDCPECPDMVVVRAGTFTMGTPPAELAAEREAGRGDFEGPQIAVSLDAFAIARTEVTIGQWLACVDAGFCTARPGGHNVRVHDDPAASESENLDRPAVWIGLDDALDYIAFLNAQVPDADPYSLPSEAQWEYAARAGTSTMYPWGDTADRQFANWGHDGECCERHYDGDLDPYPATAPVGQYPPNDWGLLDMHGNAYEWTADLYREDLSLTPRDGTPLGRVDGADSDRRVVRGGSYYSPRWAVRSADRNTRSTSIRLAVQGLRPVRTIGGETADAARETSREDTNDPARAIRGGRDCDACPDMVEIPGGTVTVGVADQSGAYWEQDNEFPPAQVSVASFALARTEVTRDQWGACIDDGGCSGCPPVDGDDDRLGSHPVTGLSWFCAQSYVDWLNGEVTAGDPYFLPSEAQWEHAAEGGATAEWWGTATAVAHAHVEANGTVPVASYPPNPYGLYDMTGNVWEWVADIYITDLSRLATGGRASSPEGQSRTAERTIKGAAYYRDDVSARPARRSSLMPMEGLDSLGFRPARSLDIDFAMPLGSDPGAGVGANVPSVIRDCLDCPYMLVVPGGTFTLGSPPDEPGRQDDEGPLSAVTVDRFALARTEVTVGQWRACRDESEACRACPWDEPSGPNASDLPVTGVTWTCANAFVDWLNTQAPDGAPYHLPSEAQWEYAAQAGNDGDPYPWGTTADRSWAHFGAPDGAPLPVASRRPNAFGLFDMPGNVWEWTGDVYRPDFDGNAGDGAPTTGSADAERVFRGGAFDDRGDLIRSANRDRQAPDVGLPNVGFRPARRVD